MAPKALNLLVLLPDIGRKLAENWGVGGMYIPPTPQFSGFFPKYRVVNLFVILSMITLMIAGAVTATPVVDTAFAAQWQSKVDLWVLETTAQGETEFLVFMAEQADLSAAYSMKTKLEKGTYVFETLSELAARTQGLALAQLASLGVEHRSYWVANMIWVRGDVSVIQAMAQRPDVAHIYANPTVHIKELPNGAAPSEGLGPLNPSTVEWNIDLVNAPGVWAEGVTGKRAIIAGQDTGYDWDHPALINQYRGWDGSNADHSYSWHDAIHSGGGSCGFDSPEPCDDYGHGTHTLGTMVGDDGVGNQIGMAPSAKWIGCRNMDVGYGTPTTYSECFQWFIAPTDQNDQNPDPSKAPDVISNSWSCPPSEGCNPDSLLAVVQNTRAAGIVVVVSAGNSGSSCSTVSNPTATYTETFSVGATDSSDVIASYSSRGPSTFTGGLKPNISAPGSGVRSSIPGGGYASMNGTSMAAPHVAGLAGLLISANPALAGQVDLIEDIIEQTAAPRTTTQTCGGVPGSSIPNNTYGWGRIDALAAYRAVDLLEVAKTASSTYIDPGGLLTYTLTVTHTQGMTITNNVVLTDVIPANTTFVTATWPHTLDGTTVQWDNPGLDVGENWSVALVVQVDGDATGTVSNDNYGARSDEVAPTSGAPVDTSVIAYDLGLSKSASAGVVPAGDALTYTLTVTNLHPLANATNVVLIDVIPANTTLVTATWPHTFDGTTVQWDAASVSPGGSWPVQLVVQVAMTATGSVDNLDYAARSDQVSMVAGQPLSTPITVVGVALVTHLSATAAPGETVRYTHTLTNTGAALDSYDLAYVSSQGWNALVNTPITLNPGEAISVVISLTVPLTATNGMTDTLILTATSQANPSVYAVVMDMTIVGIQEPLLKWKVYLPIMLQGSSKK